MNSITDVPSVFELRLNLSQRTLHCLASTREEPSQLRLDLYQIDYDAVERPFARTDFNSSGISSGQTRKGNQGIVVIEGTVALQVNTNPCHRKSSISHKIGLHLEYFVFGGVEYSSFINADICYSLTCL